MVPPSEPRSYYGEPVIAKPVWKPQIPFYFFSGGLAGASLPLALLARARGNAALARSASATAVVAGAGVSPALLITDLGRPERFLNMLRVFKPTSPMSVGSWVLAAFGASATAGAARDWLGLWPRVTAPAQAAGVVLGPVLSTYTATLISNTAVPVWRDARRELPLVFAAGSAASAGAAAVLTTPARHAAPARRLAVAGCVAEVAATQVMEHRLGPIGEPYRKGLPSHLGKAAKALVAAGGLALAGRAPRPARARAGAAAVLAGAVLTRWSVFRAGIDSALDPKYTVGPQRERLDD